MALIKCPDCHKEISDQAKICIHCDRSFKRKSSTNNKKGKTMITIGWGIMLFAMPPISSIIMHNNIMSDDFDSSMLAIYSMFFVIGWFFVIFGTIIKSLNNKK